MRIEPISAIIGFNEHKPKKQLTVSGCCDIIDISAKQRTIKLGKHEFIVTVVHCTSCGSIKATSNIKEKK